MKLESRSITDGRPIPEQYAFGKIHPNDRVALTDNRNPQLEWSDAPAGTKSFALICVDPDVPSKPDDVNKPDREVPDDLPRTDFHHWVMVDIPPDCNGIKAGSCSDGVTARGKREPAGPEHSRQGINNYTDWFQGDEDMEGQYFGYDGPCPPWNDSIVHHYHFRLFALDLDRVPVDGAFTGPEVLKAIEGHVLAEAEITGTYTLNPRLKSS